MKTRKCGSSDLELTQIGLGTWAIGGSAWLYGWGPQDDEASIKTIYKALDMGINWIDTAAVYGLGHSEKVIGKAIAGMSERPIIATKCSRKANENGTLFGDLSKDGIKREAEESLRRLNIDVIDLYQIHWPDPDEDIEQGWEGIAELIKEGKVRYGGVSNFSVDQLKRIVPIHPVSSLQPPYSMIRREIEQEHLGFCKENNIGIICYSPMYKGLLTGKITKERIDNMPDSDHRKMDPHFKEPELSINLEFVKELETIAQKLSVSLAQLAIAWTLRHQAVTAAIVGARHPEQIPETAAAADIEIPLSIQSEIETLLEQRENRVSTIKNKI